MLRELQKNETEGGITGEINPAPQDPADGGGGGISYGTFAASSVAGIFGLIIFSIVAVIIYKRFKFKKSLPSGKCHFFVALDESNGEAETKTDMLREWLRLKGYRVWYDLMADTGRKQQGVRDSSMFILFLTPGIFNNSNSNEVGVLVQEAVQANKPILLIHEEGFDFSNVEYGTDISEEVKSKIVPKLFGAIESIEFSYRSESPEKNSNITVLACEMAYYKRKRYTFSKLDEAKNHKLQVVIPYREVQVEEDQL